MPFQTCVTATNMHKTLKRTILQKAIDSTVPFEKSGTTITVSPRINMQHSTLECGMATQSFLLDFDLADCPPLPTSGFRARWGNLILGGVVSQKYLRVDSSKLLGDRAPPPALCARGPTVSPPRSRTVWGSKKNAGKVRSLMPLLETLWCGTDVEQSNFALETAASL